MLEAIRFCFSPINIPFTILLIVVVLYWLAVILGAADIEMLDGDGLFDMSEMEAESSGITGSFLHHLHVGELPTMIILSVMVLCGWAFSLIANYYANPDQSLPRGALLLLPNALFTFLITAFVTRYLVKFYFFLDSDVEAYQDSLNQVGVVITSRVTPDFGQVQIKTRGAPITVNVRVAEGIDVVKGDKVRITDKDEERGIYFVEKLEP